MKTEIKKFLDFNGKSIYLLSANGTWYIAIKPICEALGVDYENQRRLLQKDQHLNQLPSKHTVVATDGKPREMVCLPEMFIYGWLFSLKSKSEALAQYKLECYKILYNHFHGTITQRVELLGRQDEVNREIREAQKALQESDAMKRLIEAKAKTKEIVKSLNDLDTNLVNRQYSILFKT